MTDADRAQAAVLAYLDRIKSGDKGATGYAAYLRLIDEFAAIRSEERDAALGFLEKLAGDEPYTERGRYTADLLRRIAYRIDREDHLEGNK